MTHRTRTKRLPAAISLAVLLLVAPAFAEEARPVDLVICLDTSGSMKALLDDVRAQLWDVVNEFGSMSPTPALRVGLLSYGIAHRLADDGGVVVRADLTGDIDLVFDRLMELRTSGDTEYVGWALTTAVENLSWSEDDDALKIIFIAGNESADQGVEYHDFRDAAAEARRRGILINAVYAGPFAKGVAEKWPEIAQVGEGIFTAVSLPRTIAQVATPQDSTLRELNSELNHTYVPLGTKGEEHMATLKAQDERASEIGPRSFGSRVVTKSSPLYGSQSWDLVNAMERPDFDWTDLAPEDLPEELRGLGEDELMEVIERRRAEREAVRGRIREVDAERREFLRSKSGGDAEGAGAGVGGAIRETIRKQAQERGFTAEE